MKRGLAFKAWVYLLCVSFSLLASGFHRMIAEATEIANPLGDVVSRGEVKFESRKGVWKNVELSQFPIYAGMRIKTEKGASLVTLEGNCQIEVRENSLLSFDGNSQIQLTQGAIDFRLPPTAKLRIQVGDMTVMQWKSLQTSLNPSAVSSKGEATIGSILVHSNGAVTINNLRGSLSVLNQEGTVLASLSSKDTVTLPSVTVKTPPRVMVAQGDGKTSNPDPQGSRFLGIPIWIWTTTLSVAALAAILAVGLTSGGGGGGGPAVPVCP
jgi:hypothetical protein